MPNLAEGGKMAKKVIMGETPTPSVNLFENLMANVLISTKPLKETAAASAEKPVSLLEKVEEKVENYLKKGERLMTLAREAFSKNIHVDISELEQNLLKTTFKANTYDEFREGLARVFRKYLGTIVGEVEESEAVGKITELLGGAYDIRLTEAISGNKPEHVYRSYCGKGAVMVALSLREQNDGKTFAMQMECPSVGKWGKGVRRYRRHRYLYLYDLGTVLADLYISKVVSEALFDENSYASLNNKWIREGSLYNLIGNIGEGFVLFTQRKTYSGKIVEQWKHSEIEEIGRLLGDDVSLRVYECTFEDVPKENYEGYKLLDTSWVDTLRKAAVLRDCVLNKKYLPLNLLYGVSKYQSVDFIFPETKESDAIDFSAIAFSPSDWVNYELKKLYASIYPSGTDDKRTAVKQQEYFTNLKKEHAKAYQEKKNIPQKTVKAMEKSKFNKWFGYVEFDEKVDLEKVEELEKEFEATMDTFFPSIKMEDNALRFRFIGNHKAIGLYYPFVKCLVVDVRYPSSFIHEFGHLLDYKFGNLSTGGAFYNVRQLYEKEVDRAMGSDENNKKKWGGSGKYNRAYYLTPTEVFARSFEIYMAKVKGLENSLLKMPDGYESFCYPSSDEYIKAITEYFNIIFDRLFNRVVEEKEEIA